MSKLIILIIIIATSIACTDAQESAEKKNPQTHSIAVTFRLFPTENMWTFILLDQFDGRVWQVQCSVTPVKENV